MVCSTVVASLAPVTPSAALILHLSRLPSSFKFAESVAPLKWQVGSPRPCVMTLQHEPHRGQVSSGRDLPLFVPKGYANLSSVPCSNDSRRRVVRCHVKVSHASGDTHTCGRAVMHIMQMQPLAEPSFLIAPP